MEKLKCKQHKRTLVPKLQRRFLTVKSSRFAHRRLTTHFSSWTPFSDSVLCWFIFIKPHHARQTTPDTRWTQLSWIHDITYAGWTWIRRKRNYANVVWAQFCKYPDDTVSGVLLPPIASECILPRFNNKSIKTSVNTGYTYYWSLSREG